MADDHAAKAISSYGGGLNDTPNIDRIAHEGVRFDHCYVTNSICTPSRAAILTGTYNHVNCVKTLDTHMDNDLPHVAKHLQTGGYQTAIVGKWHLGEGKLHEPKGFNFWSVLPGQGEYFDPFMIEMGTEREEFGYVTDIITSKCINWLNSRDESKPFFLMCHHKAPHREWEPHPKNRNLFGKDIKVPETFDDNYKNRAKAAAEAKMRIKDDMKYADLGLAQPEGGSEVGERVRPEMSHRKIPNPDDVSKLRLIDKNSGEVFTFFLGEHGWFDKRFMYEESLQMPFLARFPKKIAGAQISKNLACNVDFAPTFLDAAQLEIPTYMQGHSLMPIMNGKVPKNWQSVVYHRYWMHRDPDHNAYSHYGIRDQRYKLIYWYNEG